jgi:peptide/nickel transport system substrate-binding protein
MENSKRGGYRIICRNMFRQIKFSILFNFTHTDPYLRRLFNDIRFRRALSLGMDREEIRDFCLQGLGEPSQVVPNPKSTWFEADVMKYDTTRDVKKANELLDAIGLRWDRKHRYRLRGDGKPLFMTIKSIASTVEGMELIREQWREIGVHIVVTPVESGYWYTMLRAGNYDLTTTGVNAAWNGCFRHAVIVPPYHCDYPAPKWGLWESTNGKVGEEPPDWVKAMLALVDPILGDVRGPRRTALIRRMTRMFVESHMEIGGVMVPKQSLFAVVKNNFRNVPDPLPNLMCCQPAIFYIRKE